jgi:hypothetical protein
MLWPNAAGRHADVIQRVAGPDWADVELVGVPMREHLDPRPLAPDVEVPVAVPANGAPPHPAASSALDLGLEPLAFGLRRWSHPTKYTEWIGTQLLAELRVAA